MAHAALGLDQRTETFHTGAPRQARVFSAAQSRLHLRDEKRSTAQAGRRDELFSVQDTDRLTTQDNAVCHGLLSDVGPIKLLYPRKGREPRRSCGRCEL